MTLNDVMTVISR